MRIPVVIDTNVLLVANGGPAYSKLCVFECAKQLITIQEFGLVVLDYGHEILTEYGRKQKATGQPGIGFQFWKWLLNTRGSSEHCEWVTITKSELRGYAEFPDHTGLTAFDQSDRKFVAVAIIHGARPAILQAADSKWWGWKGALEECGVSVEFVCPTELEATFRKKIGHV